jgi:hypothetical protein
MKTEELNRLAKRAKSLWPMSDDTAAAIAEYCDKRATNYDDAVAGLMDIRDGSPGRDFPGWAVLQARFGRGTTRYGEGDPGVVRKLMEVVRKEILHALAQPQNQGVTFGAYCEGHRQQCEINAADLGADADAGFWRDRAAACSRLMMETEQGSLV